MSNSVRRAFVKLTTKGAAKVPNGRKGMTFLAELSIGNITDYRYVRKGKPTLRNVAPEDYEVVVWF